MAQKVKDPVLSLLWLGSLPSEDSIPGLGNLHILQAWGKKINWKKINWKNKSFFYFLLNKQTSHKGKTYYFHGLKPTSHY